MYHYFETHVVGFYSIFMGTKCWIKCRYKLPFPQHEMLSREDSAITEPDLSPFLICPLSDKLYVIDFKPGPKIPIPHIG